MNSQSLIRYCGFNGQKRIVLEKMQGEA